MQYVKISESPKDEQQRRRQSNHIPIWEWQIYLICCLKSLPQRIQIMDPISQQMKTIESVQ